MQCMLLQPKNFDGSLSGALVREAISWGKVTKRCSRDYDSCRDNNCVPIHVQGIIRKTRKVTRTQSLTCCHQSKVSNNSD